MEPCPRCKHPGFTRAFNTKGHCWWCSQETMVAVCTGNGQGCGMHVCAPCLGGKLKKPAPTLPSDPMDDPSQSEFTI